MSNMDSGYDDGDSWARPMAQPNSQNLFFTQSQQQPQSEDFLPYQYIERLHPYQDTLGTSVSALESQPDYISPGTLADLPDQEFVSNPLSLEVDLAGLDPFPMDPLDDTPAYSNTTPNTSVYPDFSQDDSTLFPSFDNDPWNGLANPPSHVNTMQSDDNPYARASGNKRRRYLDSAMGSQQTPTSRPSGSVRTSTDQQTPHPRTSPSPSFNNGQSISPFSRDPPLVADQISPARRRPSSPQSQQSQLCSAPKGKKESPKFTCDHCSHSSFAGFGTWNDLLRHRRGVHGIFERGDKIWRCKTENCAVRNKIWPRRDNFLSHLKRMHFGGEDDPARDIIDHYQEYYDAAIHGSLGFVKPESARGSRAKTAADAPSVMAPPAARSVSGGLTAQQPAVTGFASGYQRSSNQYNGGLALNTTLQGLSTMSSPSVTVQGSVDASVLSPPALSPLPLPQSQHIYAFSAPPNIDTMSRQRYEMHQQDREANQLPNLQPSLQDTREVGQFITVDPVFLSNNAGIDLDDTEHEERSKQVLARALERLDPEEKNLLAMLSTETLKQLLHKGSGPVPDSSARSVSKPPTKKKADGEKKSVMCDEPVAQKGDKAGILSPCGSVFSSYGELRKHKKRHKKRFGCTFDNCYSKFGTKWEWKRHEQSQHIQNEAWRCRYGNGDARCHKLFTVKQEFMDHLSKQHNEANFDIETETRQCWVAHKWLGSYWCGHCVEIIKSQNEFGRDMCSERIEHISRHFEAECKPSEDWIEIGGGGLTKRQTKATKDGHSTQSREQGVGSVSAPVVDHDHEERELEDIEEQVDATCEENDSESSWSEDRRSPTISKRRSQRLPPSHVQMGSSSVNIPGSQQTMIGTPTSPPTIHITTSEGFTVSGSMFDNTGIGLLGHVNSWSNNNNLHDPNQMMPPIFEQPLPDLSILGICCRCETPIWGNMTLMINPMRCQCQHVYCRECRPDIPPMADGSQFVNY